MNVAPFTGAWIEISDRLGSQFEQYVAPFTGAWIEIHHTMAHADPLEGRSLHGGVD